MMNRIRILLAFIIVPLFPVALFGMPFTDNTWVVLTAVLYSITICIGLPIYFHLRRKKGLKFIPIVFGTFTIGIIIGLLLLLPESPENMTINNTALIKDGMYTLQGIISEITNIVTLGIIGFATGAIWWFVGVAAYNNSLNPDGANNAPPG